MLAGGLPSKVALDGASFLTGPLIVLRAARRHWGRLLLPLALVLVGLALWKHHEPSVDFHTYAAAARVGLAQGWADIYDQAQVAAAQVSLVPGQVVQPFLSPPPVALLTAPLALLPYGWAFPLWSATTFAALLLALVWAGTGRNTERWAVALAAVASTWVVHAVHVGQVVPLVAAGVVLSWRLMREDRDLLAGFALSLILLKPNTAFLVPLALLFAGRVRVLAGMAIAASVVLAVTFLSVGVEGFQMYFAEVTRQLPNGADYLTIKGAFGLQAGAATGLRLVIVGIAAFAALRLRRSPGSVLAAGTVASLLATPYLHEADLCLLTAAAWLVWEEHRSLAWRGPLVAVWLLSAPVDALVGSLVPFNRWPLVEVAVLLALGAWGVRQSAYRRPFGAD
jgi:hypothetical protein